MDLTEDVLFMSNLCRNTNQGGAKPVPFHDGGDGRGMHGKSSGQRFGPTMPTDVTAPLPAPSGCSPVLVPSHRTCHFADQQSHMRWPRFPADSHGQSSVLTLQKCLRASSCFREHWPGGSTCGCPWRSAPKLPAAQRADGVGNGRHPGTALEGQDRGTGAQLLGLEEGG